MCGNGGSQRRAYHFHVPRDEDPNPVIFGPPDPVLFSTDPDPTCNNGFIKLFLSWTKYKSESTNSSIKWWVIISIFVPTYLKYKNIFFFISISGRIRIFFSAEPDPDPDPASKDRLPVVYGEVGVGVEWIAAVFTLNANHMGEIKIEKVCWTFWIKSK